MTRILITGGTGLLGKALIETNDEAHSLTATFVGDYEMSSSDRAQYVKLDIRDEDGYRALFEELKPQIVIHTASIGSPDYAEKYRELTWGINVGGTAMICQLCKRSGSKLIHISSNGIYDGDHAPYAEEAKAEPINYYGLTKYESEQVVLRSSIVSAIIRPILMYGWNNPTERSNIVTLALEKLRKNELVYAYEDVFSNPLYNCSAAAVIWHLIEKKLYQPFNVAGADVVSIYELIRTAARVFCLDEKLIVPVKQGYFNELVPRPKNTSYRTEKMQNLLGVRPLSLVQGLEIMKREK
jgi:dTDP-4-dehydrorhamnose reductase